MHTNRLLAAICLPCLAPASRNHIRLCLIIVGWHTPWALCVLARISWLGDPYSLDCPNRDARSMIRDTLLILTASLVNHDTQHHEFVRVQRPHQSRSSSTYETGLAVLAVLDEIMFRTSLT